MSYETPLPYSAIDPDYAICPIPLLERPGYSLTQRYLDREVCLENRFVTSDLRIAHLSLQDVIEGTMLWKNMSSTGLSALTQVPTMSNVWLPRWWVVTISKHHSYGLGSTTATSSTESSFLNSFIEKWFCLLLGLIPSLPMFSRRMFPHCCTKCPLQIVTTFSTSRCLPQIFVTGHRSESFPSLSSEMNEENKLILTPEMIHAEFIEAHMEVTNNSRQE